jgi:putative toxin-antitoxin system antitoxin component (TIGR02293 family)
LTTGQIWRTIVLQTAAETPVKAEATVRKPRAGIRGAQARVASTPASHSPADWTERERRFYTLSVDFLGGKKFWRRRITSRADVHSAIVRGVPYASLIFFVNQVSGLEEADVVKVLGISGRTLRRQAEASEKPMPADLASKTWLFAETLAKATEIFGGKEQAERWMSRPAIGLDGQRPIELLQTLQGAELVSDFLGRLEYGVYT